VSIEICTQIRLQIRLITLELGVQDITLKPPGSCCTYKSEKCGGLFIPRLLAELPDTWSL